MKREGKINIKMLRRINLVYSYIRLIVFLLLIPLTSKPDHKEPYFHHYKIADGLPQNSITAICQDSLGFMWFGTREAGLCKFDGINFVTYHHTHRFTGLSSSSISSLLAEKSGSNIWVGTLNGLNFYNQKKDSFETGYYLDKDNIPFSFSGKAISDIEQAPNNDIWIIASNQIYQKRVGDNFFRIIRFPKKTQISSIEIVDNDSLFVAHNNQVSLCLLERDGILKIIQTQTFAVEDYIVSLKYDNKNLFAGFFKNGFAFHSYKSNETHIYSPQNTPKMKSGFIRTFESNHGKMYIGSFNGLYIFDPRTKHIEAYFADRYDNSSLSHSSILNLYRDKANNIWIGTYSGGISVKYAVNYNFKTYSHNTYHSVSSDVINTFFENEHGIWIGTDGRGISLFKSGKFTTYNLPTGSGEYATHIKAIFQKDRKHLWIGGHESGLTLFDLESKTVKQHLFPQHFIYSIQSDSSGLLWMGSSNKGLVIFDPVQSKEILVKNLPEKLKSRVKITHYSSNENLMWVCSAFDVFFYNFRSKKFVKLKLSEHWNNPDHLIHHLYEDHLHNIWIATSAGLYKIDGINKENGTCNTTVYNTDNILSNNNIMSIIEDENGQIWISSIDGISKMDPSRVSVENFNRNYNIQGGEFSMQAAFKSSDGQLWFGGNQGFTTFDPSELQKNTYVPPIAFTRLTVNNRPIQPGDSSNILSKNISLTRDLKLNHLQNNIVLDVVALNYNTPKGNRYKWELKTSNRKVMSGDNIPIHINNLPPNDYILQVNASNNNGVWSKSPLILSIKITPPWYKTGWAYLLFALLSISILYIVAKTFYERRKNLFRLKLEQHRNKLKEQQIEFFTNISHEIRTPLSLILAPLNIAYNEAEKPSIKLQLNYANKNAKLLLNLVNQLLDSRKIENKQRKLKVRNTPILPLVQDCVDLFKHSIPANGPKISFTNKISLNKGYFDIDIVTSIIYNLLTNALKYNRNNHKIKIHVDHHFLPNHILLCDSVTMGTDIPGHIKSLTISVEDRGVGIEKNEIEKIFNRFYQTNTMGKGQGYGIGLALVKSLALLHRGEIKIESKKGLGSRFSVKIPIERHYYPEDKIHTEVTDTISYSHEENEYIHFESNEIKKTTILIVENNDELRNWIQDFLNKIYICYVSSNGRDGLEIARKKTPNIIISDIMMPEMDGIEFCQKVKTNKLTSHIPVILLTAKSTEPDTQAGIEAGADLYITKPFNAVLLLGQIQNLLTLREKIIQKYNLLGDDESFMESLSSYDRKTINAINTYIEKNLDDTTLNVETLAKEVGMSRASLYRKINALTGSNPKLYIRDYRLSIAAKLLKEHKYDTTHISEKVGFSDLYYFRKCFEQKYGVKPEMV